MGRNSHDKSEPDRTYLWHGESSYFGLGEAKGKVSVAATLVAVLLFILLAGIEMMFGHT
jgi:hypothetical protein